MTKNFKDRLITTAISSFASLIVLIVGSYFVFKRESNY